MLKIYRLLNTKQIHTYTLLFLFVAITRSYDSIWRAKLADFFHIIVCKIVKLVGQNLPPGFL